MRSKLFVPGSRPELFPKALASAADSLSFDLEDAVAESSKDEARRHVGAALQSEPFATSTKIMIVRVNAVGSPHFMSDLEAVVWPRVDLINVPKIESAADVTVASSALRRIESIRGIPRHLGLLLTIETPAALRKAAEIAAADARVAGLQLGFADLLEPLGIDRTHAAAIQQIQLALRLAAGEAGVWCCDAAWAAINDTDGFRAEAIAARRLGFIGKSCIHPRQVGVANEVFQPTAQEIAFAARVVAEADKAAAAGVGAFIVDGRMVDAPFVRRARIIAALGSQNPAAS
jgi:citrate lyase subunit beta / citryl-CoA lyase